LRGATYTHRLTRGPYQGEHCRIVEQLPGLPDYFRVKIRNRKTLVFFPVTWIVPLNGGKRGIPRKHK
jgi:hypothetical protein